MGLGARHNPLFAILKLRHQRHRLALGAGGKQFFENRTLHDGS
jgi:hypothetical protein